MRLPLLTERIDRKDIANILVGDGISPSDCNCNYDCRRSLPFGGSYDDPICLAQAAACRAGCASCQDKCAGWHAAASAACVATLPGYPACEAAADAAYAACLAGC